MDFELSGKLAFVTGSSRGIGYSIAKRLASEGCTVVLNGRDNMTLRESADNLAMPWIQGDVCDPDCARDVVDRLLRAHGQIDILVTNVGSGASVKGANVGRREWLRMLELNLLSATQIVEAATPALLAKRGVILCISSICGLAAFGAPIAYSAAKAALNSYVKEMSAILGPAGVRINGLAPGNVLFPGSTWERKLNEDAKAVETMLKTQVPLRRFATPSEIADIAVFLCSPRASFVTGTIVIADGGQIRV